ncbi:MAG: hypothetical protein LBC27_08680 [Spirochaetaceae bacterium]|jgi:hypothetical protein|nr:hypothetical protein [Spirochaetaceae bacterium]
MNNKRFFLPFFVCVTFIFVISITGCDKSVFPTSHLEENQTDNSQTPQLPENPQTPQLPQSPQAPENPQPPQPPQASQPPDIPQSLTWYVSTNGNSANKGTDPASPLAQAADALSKIKNLYKSGKWPAGESAVIIISGTVTGSGNLGANGSMLDVSGAGNYPPIILKGDPSTGGILDANGANTGGRILYIANNKVTLGDKLTLTGGARLWGGAVCVGTAGSDSEGEFIMAGGEISGNKGGSGGAVMVYKGGMTMSGGIIKNNSNNFNQNDGNGGGIYLNAYTSFTMTGGTIAENGDNVKTENGGGLFIDGRARAVMSGGEILNNTARNSGGGVNVSSYGEFTMTGGTISGNTAAEKGSVYVEKYGAVFNRTGGVISGNTPD